MKRYSKKTSIMLLSLLLSACSVHNNKDSVQSENSSNDVQEKKIEKINNSNNLSHIYGKQVDLTDLIGMPQINNNQSEQLLSMISGKENEYRAIMEKEIITKNLSFKEVCLGLNGVLCDINNEVYKGTRFGVSLYSRVAHKDILSNRTADIVARTWSVNWIKSSIESAKNINKMCSVNKDSDDSNCIASHSNNPIVEIYAHALDQENDKLMQEYLKVKLLSPAAKKYLFDIGFLSGYSIGYDVDNKIPFVDKYKGHRSELTAETVAKRKETVKKDTRSPVEVERKSPVRKESHSVSANLPKPKLEVEKPTVKVAPKEPNVESKIDDLIDSVNG